MFGNRKVVFKALVGSHNYNLDDVHSDRDYKYFVLPTFSDLYTGNRFSGSKVGTEEDYTVHDIRKLTDLCWKANINFLEVLYSNEVTIPYDPKTFHILESIMYMRKDIVVMNLPYLFSACKGMHFQKMKNLKNPTKGTQYLVDAFGYDTKGALHAYRVLDFIIRFHKYDWDFERAMVYTDVERDYILRIKHGSYTLDFFKSFVSTVYDEFLTIESIYKAQIPNLETKGKLEDLVKDMVHQNINFLCPSMQQNATKIEEEL